MEITLLESASINLAVEFVYKLVALFVLWLMLRLLERFNGRRWSNTIEKIEEDRLALSIYQSAVWLGCAIVVAS